MKRMLVLNVLAVATLLLGGLAPATAQAEEKPVREVEIVVEGGYHPSKVAAKAGERLRLKFVRKEYSGCTKEVVFPTLGLRKQLPVNEAVMVDLPALEGEIPFHCGMKMIRGSIQVEASR